MNGRACAPRPSSSTATCCDSISTLFSRPSLWPRSGNPHVRRWRKQLLDAGTSSVTAAKAYRLLKAILTTAADDGVIRRNPCRIKGAGQEKSPERPVLTIPQVFALADAIGQRYRALVLLAVFGSLRWGELAALRRSDIDLDARTVSITRQLTEVSGHLAFGPPKSDAGKRIIVVPALIIPDLRWHLSCFAQPGDDGLVFTARAGCRSGTVTSAAASGSRRSGRQACHPCTFMIFAMPGTCSPPPPGRRCAS